MSSNLVIAVSYGYSELLAMPKGLLLIEKYIAKLVVSMDIQLFEVQIIVIFGHETISYEH